MNGYNQSPFANITPVVKNLLIINVLFFIGSYALGKVMPGLIELLPAYYFNSPKFRVWQIITYMFMHGGIAHIFFNMFVLFSFGPIVEYAIGAKRFLNFYFLCGIGAILLQILVQAIEVHGITGSFTIAHPELDSSYMQFGAQAQKLFTIYNTAIVGASGAIFGLMIAFRMLYPELELMIMFIPIPVKAKYLIPVLILWEVYAGFKQSSGDSVAHFAHLGGALIGFILVKIWKLQNSGNY
jgi:membrane associated rhomboid family serine protease